MKNMKKDGTPRIATKRARPKPLPSGPRTPAPRRGNATPVPLGTPPARPTGRRINTRPLAGPGAPKKSPTGAKQKPLPKTTKKAPSRITSLQDAAKKRIFEKQVAANPRVAKRAPLETKRIGGVFAVPVKPKKTIY